MNRSSFIQKFINWIESRFQGKARMLVGVIFIVSGGLFLISGFGVVIYGILPVGVQINNRPLEAQEGMVQLTQTSASIEKTQLSASLHDSKENLVGEKPAEVPFSSDQHDEQSSELPSESFTRSLTPVLIKPITTPTLTKIINTPTPKPTQRIIEPIKIKTNPTDEMPLVFVPEGEFTMGSDPETDPYFWGAEGPSHQVMVDAFWIYQTEVTNAMYEACVAVQACPKPLREESRTVQDYYSNPNFSNYPVIQVSWVGAVSYCNWAGGRLPTEAEWEKAARGTDGRLFPWGNQRVEPELASFCGTRCPSSPRENIDDGYLELAPVGMFPSGASPYGVLDMAGNVWEWVFDYFDSQYYSGAPYDNPKGPLSGNRRVFRGGSWAKASDGLRTVVRLSLPQGEGLDTLGFRCVWDE